MYKFSLKFNSENEDLGFDNGVQLNQLGELLSSIYTVVRAKKSDKIILSDVSDNCYQIDVSTINPTLPNRFVNSSISIYEKSNSELDNKELRYKRILSKVLKQGWYVEILDGEGSSRLKIPHGFNEKTIEYYYSNKSFEGIITEIGDKDLDPSNLHIYISNNTDFKIFIDDIQHDELKKYYRDQKVRVKVRLKKSLESDKILSAELKSFKIKSKLNFPFNLRNIDLSSLKYINE